MFSRKGSDRYYRGFVTNIASSQVSVRLDDGSTIQNPTSDAAAVILDELPSTNELVNGRSVIARGGAKTPANSFSDGEITQQLETTPNGCPKYKVDFKDETQRSMCYYQIRILPV